MSTIRGSRVTLRPLREEEFEAYWASRERWMEETYQDGDRETARAKLRVRIRESGDWTPNGIEFAIEADGRLQGDIQARTNPGQMPAGVLELGIELFDEASRGKGLGSEAIQLMVADLFERREAVRVQLSTDVENERMRKTAETLGFGFEGVMRGFMPSPKGPRDYAMYGLTAEDYKGLRSGWARAR
jgi:RimJ/RimL family protein N-acetyltransferase